MPFLRTLAAAGAVGAFVTFGLPAASLAADKCGPLPQVDWWTSTHAEVNKLVEDKYHGNWDPYITRWKKYETRMKRVLENGGTAVVKSRGIKLNGKLLKAHIRDIETRIAVLQCLKSAAADAGPAVSEIETAAGSVREEAKSLPRFDRPVQMKLGKAKGNDAAKDAGDAPAQIASIDDGDFQLEVSARCSRGEVIFQITNVGDKWPRLGAISIHRTDTGATLSKRRMRLNNSQQATFRVRKKQVADVGEVGLWIEPSWFDRKFHYDSKIACN